jgi:cob(I)alamin adenosyltransferase
MTTPRIYTRKGDDGTTGLYFGGRVPKDSARPSAYGDVDELQSVMGLARSHPHDDARLDEIVISLQRDLWVVMADLATGEDNRHKLTDDSTRVTAPMIERLESLIDEIGTWFTAPTEFVVPGGDVVAATLDVARTVARRAERSAVSIGDDESLAVGYLNRLSDLLWQLARWVEGTSLTVRSLPQETP